MRSVAVQGAHSTRESHSSAPGLLNKSFLGLSLLEWAFALFVSAVALIGLGEGSILTDGQAELHIDAIGFLKKLWYAWDPSLFLGFNTGFSHVYYSFYGWAYAVMQWLHVPDTVAQRTVFFIIYLSISYAMLWGMAQVAPRMSSAGRLAAASAFLFNIYVAFNTNGSGPMLLAYASLPLLVGICARVIDGRTNLISGGIAVGFVNLFAAGINPPLLVINAFVTALYGLVILYASRSPVRILSRLALFGLSSAVASLAINAYWIVPFLGYFKGVWLGGVLDESPAMHNLDSSFANVLRGLGQWSIFQGNQFGPWYSWAASYASGVFGALLWVVPIVAIAALAIRRRRQRALAAFFALVIVVSVPLVVGYYSSDGHPAITSAIYDFLYRRVPNFQMFRAAYKWVMPYEFAVAGLFGIAVDRMWIAWRQRRRPVFARAGRATAVILLIATPLICYWPVLQYKANKAMPPLPSWIYRESSFVPSTYRYRVAIFPTQYLEQFDWGAPTYYVENSTIKRPMIAGYLGDLQSRGSDQWVKLAYRQAALGDQDAAWTFRMLGVDRILQRDDFISVQDFSQFRPGYVMTTTLAHQLIGTALAARQLAVDGPNRLYALDGAAPIVYGVEHPMVVTAPSIAIPRVYRTQELASKTAAVSIEGLSSDRIATLVGAFSTVSGGSSIPEELAAASLFNTAVTAAPAAPDTALAVPSTGVYRIFVVDSRADSPAGAALPISIDGVRLKERARRGAWDDHGTLRLRSGDHVLHVPPAFTGNALTVVLEAEDRLQEQTRSIRAALPAGAVFRQDISDVVHGRGKHAAVLAASWVKPLPDATSPLVKLRPRTANDARDLARLFSTAGSSGVSELSFLPLRGVYTTTYDLMPDNYYEHADTFTWSRGGPAAWYLIGPQAHFAVGLPGASARNVVLHMNLASRTLRAAMHVLVNGKLQSTITIVGDGPGAAIGRALALFTGARAYSIQLKLRPGMNDVEIWMPDANIYPLPDVADAVQKSNKPVVAALAPTLSFECKCAPGAAEMRVDPRNFSPNVVFGLSFPYKTLFGDPTVYGSVAYWRQKAIYWLAVRYAGSLGDSYRLVPLSSPSETLSVSLGDLLPNRVSDAETRIAGIWIVASPQDVDKVLRLKRPTFALGTYRKLQTIVGSRWIDRGSAPAGKAPLQVWRSTVPAHAPRAAHFEVRFARPVPTTVLANVPPHRFATLLVLNESYDGRWLAFASGKNLSHVLVDGYANGWIVPAASRAQRVVITYTVQRQYVASLCASVVAILVASGVLLWAAYRKLRWT